MTDRNRFPVAVISLSRLLLSVLLGIAILPVVVAQDATEAESSTNKNERIDLAQVKSEAERLLPNTALLYVQISPVDLWASHPLRNRIFESEAFQRVWDSPPVLNARTAIVAGEWAIGMKLETLAKRLTTGGVYAAIDPDTNGVAVLMRTRDEKWLQRTISKILEFARNNEANKEGERSIKSAEYRGIRGHKFQNAGFAQLGPWLLVTNQSELAKSIVDRYLDGSNVSLADTPWRVSATHGPALTTEGAPPLAATTIATAEIDLATLRSRFSSNDLFQKQAKDFGAELLLGGILELLNNAPSAAAELRLEPDALSTSVSFPTEMEWFADSREHYVGPGGEGRSLPLIKVEGSIASLSTYRNLSEMWLRAGDLFDQQVNDRLAQADNTLTTLFSGKDFGADILGALEPELRLVATLQSWEPDQAQPSVKLPAFALIGKLKDPRTMQKEMKRIFQSFIGFLNVVGAMEGQPQLDLLSETSDIGSMYWGEYVLDADRKYENGLPIQFNFSPSLAFSGEDIILSSNHKLAQQLTLPHDHISRLRDADRVPVHTELVVNGETVQQALQANRDVLIAQNILEKGHSRGEALKEIETLMGILELLDEFRLDMAFEDRSVVNLRVNYR